jgi:bifunctional DNA-binding transcriptional regulator/antitoxin component of YhaV-PrlF toxin-antitoxin module
MPTETVIRNVRQVRIMRSVKISDKNQVAIPQDVLNEVGAKRGERLVVRARGKVIELIPEKMADDLLDEGYRTFQREAGKSFEKYWDNPYDEVWNDVTKYSRPV